MKIHKFISLMLLVVLFSCKDEPEENIYSKVITESEFDGITQNGKVINGPLLHQYIYYYDLEGNLADEQVFDANGKLELKTLYTYNAVGYTASAFNSKNELVNHYTAINNDKGKVWELKVYSPGDVLVSEIQYSYDASDFLTEQTVHYFSDNESFVYVLKYINDEDGNVLKVQNYGSGDTVLSETTNEYLRWNHLGEWLTRKTTLNNGTIRITERKYTTY